MILLRSKMPRRGRDDLLLGAITALNAGLVNVCSVIAFFAFSSNVTGHVAVFAEEISKGHWYQVSVVVGWMAAFLFGAFLAKFTAGVTEQARVRPWLGQVVAHVLQIGLLAGVAFYGSHHYAETLFESEMLVGVLLFTMGLQNGSVASASDGVVKTSHVTGLFTDLGTELAQLVRARRHADAALRFKFALHVTILVGYVVGGLLGGSLYLRIGFTTFYVGCALLVLLLAHDLAVVALRNASRDRAGTAPMLERVSRDPG